jgi:ankyrin repeat protein
MDLSPSDAMTALLLRRGYKLSIHAAAAKGMLEEVQRMLGEDPARIRALDGEGLQPLHSACIGGHENIVALLIERGADVTHLGANCRPLTYACIWGRDKIVPLLLKLDRDINAITTGYQLSYLHCVVRWAKGTPAANEAIIRMLFKAGIDSSIRNKDGMTAYDMAVERGAEGKAMAELIKELGGTP